MRSQIDIENKLCIVSLQTISEFLKDETPYEVIALYLFYYHWAKRQKTNQPRCTIKFAASGLKMGEHKVRAAKKRLIDLGLIQDVRQVDDVGRTVGWFVRLNYIWSKEEETKLHPYGTYKGGKIEESEPKLTVHPHSSRKGGVYKSNKNSTNPTLTENHTVGNCKVNALSDRKEIINTLSRVVVSESVEDRQLYPVINKFKKKTGEEEMKRILAGCVSRGMKFSTAGELAKYLQGAVNKNGQQQKRSSLPWLDGKQETETEAERKERIERAKKFAMQRLK